MSEKDNQELDRAVKSTIRVHDLIGIFVHAAAVLRWRAGMLRLTRSQEP